MYYTTTKDFVDFTETKLFYDKGFTVIDSHIQKDGDRYIMFLKNEVNHDTLHKDIHIATSKTLLGNYSEPSKAITPHWTEGPTSIKINGEWVVYFDMYEDHRMGAVKSSDLENWTDITDKIDFPEGTRHGTVFKVKKSVLDNILLQK